LFILSLALTSHGLMATSVIMAEIAYKKQNNQNLVMTIDLKVHHPNKKYITNIIH
jgi:hypothetical protein